ncbi:MAG: FAD/NAD(P)-binding protein [Desulfovibrionaceae bacterium]|nr:FAD/NAD(P)-binding protein [Desulfovibrionaceae bacterium]MBF0513164.1 FAD/NAD(P)-binding protein [Desulfovibrionaceae bacterium]
MNNPYLPYPARLTGVREETEDKSIRTFRLELLDPGQAGAFAYVPGQFAELSLAGVGEAPIGIASSPTEGQELLFSVFRTGKVTEALHALAPGAVMGVRGPLGKGFPLGDLKGENLVIIAGGFAVTTLRSAMVWLLDPANRGDFGEITFIYGARTPGMLLYREQLATWAARADVACHVAVDRPAPGWDGQVGFVPQIVAEAAPRPENAAALVCGPPAMIKYTQPVLSELGWQDGQIFLSLENRMKCGIGVCGRCNVGPYYVCKDGPVFTKAELDLLPKEY